MILSYIFLLLIQRPPRAQRTYTLFPCTALLRSVVELRQVEVGDRAHALAARAHAAGDREAALLPLLLAALLDGDGARPADRGHVERERLRRSDVGRSEEHTSELQSLMRISYAVFCLKKKNNQQTTDKELM